jgi:nicotinate-nucleotide adenylyltransferase
LRTENYNQEIVKKYGLEVFNFNRIGLSSTMIRNLQKLEFQVPEINDYINYRLIYSDERIKSHLSHQRYQHSLKVGQMAQELARVHGLDESKAFVAGTLHDIAKE